MVKKPSPAPSPQDEVNIDVLVAAEQKESLKKQDGYRRLVSNYCLESCVHSKVAFTMSSDNSFINDSKVLSVIY